MAIGAGMTVGRSCFKIKKPRHWLKVENLSAKVRDEESFSRMGLAGAPWAKLKIVSGV